MSIQVKLVQAVLTHDTEIFSNMDPYCILTLGRQQYKSSVKKAAGKRPFWNQKFNFGGMDNTLIVKVMDQNTINDDLVGEGSVDISKFRADQNEHKCIVDLTYKGESAGKLQLAIQGSMGISQPQTPQLSINTPQREVSKVGQNNGTNIAVNNQFNAATVPRTPMNYGRQVMQGYPVGMSNPQIPQNNIYQYPASQGAKSSEFGDLSQNNGWGNFDPSKHKLQNPELKHDNSFTNSADNPFVMLGKALNMGGGNNLNHLMGTNSNQMNRPIVYQQQMNSPITPLYYQPVIYGYR